MFAFKATYAMAAAGLAFAAPAAAEYERGGARASESSRMNFDGGRKSNGSAWFEDLRRNDFRPGRYGHGGPGKGKPGKGHGHGHGPGNGHGPVRPCDKDDRCHTSPG